MDPSSDHPQLLFSTSVEEEPAAFAYYRRLSRVRKAALRDLSKPLSLAEAARIAGMEYTAFSSFFHRRTGVRFRDWLAVVRVNKAKEILVGRNHSIRAVSRQVGYVNVRTFQRVFRRIVGLTPYDFKSSVRPR